MTTEIRDSQFDSIRHSEGKKLIMFWGSWCPVCKQAQKMLTELSKEVDFPVYTMNVDRNPHTSSRYQIMGTPTFFFFNGKTFVFSRFGSLSKKQLLTLMGVKK